MFKRLLRLRISLAAKCQLLFGAAAILIIGAALIVPWVRIEQLVSHTNRRTAKTLSQWAEVEHVRLMVESGDVPRATSGGTMQASASVGAVTRPARVRGATRPTTLPIAGPTVRMVLDSVRSSTVAVRTPMVCCRAGEM
jgi:hypothetical protein